MLSVPLSKVPNSCSSQSCRVGKQRLREAKIQATDYLILLLAGACLGSLAKVNDQNFGAAGYTYTIIAVCKLENSQLLSCLVSMNSICCLDLQLQKITIYLKKFDFFTPANSDFRLSHWTVKLHRRQITQTHLIVMFDLSI